MGIEKVYRGIEGKAGSAIHVAINDWVNRFMELGITKMRTPGEK